MKAPAAVLVAGLLALGTCTCDKPGQPAAAARQTGTTGALRDWVLSPPLVEAEANVPCPRLLSAAPNVTEICSGLGLAGCLIGRTRFCDYPPTVQAVPSIGALNDLNVETLLELKPDLIVVSGRSRAIAERLQRLGLRFESVPDTSLADLFTAIERLGELTGRIETGRQLTAGIRADLELVTARFAAGPKARVLLVVAPLADPPTSPLAAGAGSFYDDLLRLAGHVNVVDKPGRAFAPLALEFVLQADPDVILELTPEHGARPGGDHDAWVAWSKVGPLRAVQTRRVHVLVGSQHFVLGPRIAQTLEALCQVIRGAAHE